MNKFPQGSVVCRSLIGAASGLMLCLASAQASNILPIKIIGTVISAPACVLNGNSTINVKFNNGIALETTSIDGSNYATPVPFTLSCTGNPSSLRLRFQGTGSTFDPNVLATTVTDLGIKLLRPNNSALNVGDWFTFGYSATPPDIKAVPVKRSGATLSGGVFNGSATLLVEVL
ncbi:fimbrial protein [Serratia sp. L9]|uniref:fimbrial protein n=1 Tax=Serratia sp. L9 TaxID=3423946 RepID=UPI003D67D66C